MGDVVCAQINRTVGKKGNDRRKTKTIGKQGAKVLENSLGWTLGRVLGCEAQGPCVDIGSGTAWVQGADLESTLSCPRPEGNESCFNQGSEQVLTLGSTEHSWIEFWESVNVDGKISK